MGENYYLGLDMGTGSLGWAVTDEQYNVVRRHGKSLWGVRLFESASTAEERRGFRTSRRRLDRKNWRIYVLQELFADVIAECDPGFYLRMKESKYYPEDKRDANGNCPELPYALFVDPDYTDKDYHRDFPTIYHLRKYLMETEEVPDIRFVYLAIHHMMKHRGHFLLSGDISQIKEFKGTFLQLDQNLRNEELDWDIELDDLKLSFVSDVLQNREKTKSSKKSALVKELQAKSACEKAILALISGCKVKLSDIFGVDELNETERPSISFAESTYDDYVGSVEAALGEQFYTIESAKAVYDWAILVEILGDSASISEAKVKTYEKHKADLAILKKAVRECLPVEKYKELFVKTDDKLSNYCAYAGKTAGKKCTQADFYDYLKKNIVNHLEDSANGEYIKAEMEKETFLPKQVTKDNSVIPYQIHLYELKKIIENLQDKIPFIAENGEKIIQLFEFRIPYYVGPLGAQKSEFAWAVRRDQDKKDKIYPWNFEEIIDVEASAEKFIRRMTNKCTYLVGEDVLPKDSLLYSKFMVLNELNNLRIGGEKISVELKQKVYEDLFCKHRKVTMKRLKSYLDQNGIAEKDVEITGIDGDFKASLGAYHDFKEKLTGAELSQREKETLILNIALFGDDKKLLKKRVKGLFPQLTDKQLKAICTMSYKGWGRLSRTFLEEITAPDPETGEVWNIITALWESNNNLMQLLSNEHMFMQTVEDFNSGKKDAQLTYKTVQEMYVSPAVKRQIWQTLKVIKELEKVMGGAPSRVFVEMAKEKQESRRTQSRKQQLIDLYKSCKKEERDWIAELNQRDENTFRSDKLYLYYTQKGRCMYSGEAIDLEDLWDNNKYDIDHIFPQSKTMDDSLNNRVLVKKEYNADKSDVYPIKKKIRDKMAGFWKSLLDGKFISQEKYKRLIRSEELTASELAGFIERQIVETRQGTKAVAEILKSVLPETEVVYSKAGVVAQFRKDMKLPVKVREINDLHHAKDAYLNIVVGNAYYVKFTKDAARFIKENPGRSYNLEKMFTAEKDIKRNGEVAWKGGSDGTVVTVKKVLNKNNILVTRKAYEVKGGLFDQQLMKKGKGQIPIKGSDSRLSDIQKYGGYNKAAGTYFMLVKSVGKKGEEIRTIEYVPLHMKAEIEKNKETAIHYLETERGLKDPEIRISKIKIDTLFDVDGFKMWLSGRTGNQLIFKGANQLLLSQEATEAVKKIVKYVNRKKEDRNARVSERDGVDDLVLIKLYDTFIDKIQNTVYGKRLAAQIKTLTEKREKFQELELEDKCTVLSEILHMFQCNSTAANLKMIGGPGSAGLLVINYNITKNTKISIINQSITGIYEQEIDLLKV